MATRLGKRERQERKAQWAFVRGAKADLIAHNKANLKNMPTSQGFRMSPDFRQTSALTFREPSNLARPSMIGSDSWMARRNK